MKFKSENGYLFPQVVQEISTLLRTGLDKESLFLCVRLIESGVNPVTLAQSMREILQNGVPVSPRSGSNASK